MFKRRNPKSYWRLFKEFFYPRSGWRRAINYFGHRLKRLPDTPARIARGLGMGVFVTFSPFFGLHFILATVGALLIRGNVLAALIATFVGNPLTFPIIGIVSYRFGLFIMGGGREETAWQKVSGAVSQGMQTLWTNFKSLFGFNPTRWDGFVELFWDFFVPYTVGGLLPGAICGFAVYILSKPMIEAYQSRRKGRLLAKFNSLRNKSKAGADTSGDNS